jgi:maltooligosyltrehalose synthase
MAYQASAADDRFICRSTCVLVDSAKASLYTFGAVSGKSEISTDEAFEVMAQSCRNLVSAKGFDGDAASLVRGLVQISSEQLAISSTSQADHKQVTVKSIFHFSSTRTHEMTRSNESKNQFSYRVNFADESSCGPYISNPEGHPKYIGPDTPLG